MPENTSMESSHLYSDCGNDLNSFVREIDSQNDLKQEKKRLETFINWPKSATQTPSDLARAGFYYTGITDRVRCVFCHGVLKKWLPEDDPFSEHTQHFPWCPFILGNDVGNTPLSPPPRIEIPQVGAGVTCPGHTHQDLSMEENRLVTFTNWPSHLEQTPDTLARAGFYHFPGSERPDRVKCHYCQGKLYNWQPGDDPWIEHGRCFPRCPYIRLCMGEQFLQDLLADEQREEEERNHDRNKTSEAGTAEQTSTEDSTFHERIACIMDTPRVQAVLEMGYSANLVRGVIETQLRETGQEFPSAELLASVVMETEERTKGSENKAKTRTGEVNSVISAATRTTGLIMEPSEIASVREENSRMRDQYLCKICMEAEVRVTFMPCGHLACCGQCSMALTECPICRTRITGVVRTYFS